MLNHILIPLDGSLLAAKAIDPTKQILKAGSKITLVSVIEIPNYWEFGVSPVVTFEQNEITVDQLVKRASVYLECEAAKLRAEDFQVEVVVRCGDPATVIVEIASDHKVDAISISTHGGSGFSRWLFGSVTGKVLSAAPCAVFVIPSREHSQVEHIAHSVAQN